jgi:hypothetical protein
MLRNSIPFIDLRGKTPVDLLRAYPDKARALIHSARRSFSWSNPVAAMALPVSDRTSRRWLKRTRNPYLHEIESCAEIASVRGMYTFNLSFEWGCTSGAWRTGESVSMLRVLDWPFPNMGRHMVIALQQGKAGEFYNVTWPGLSGVFNAMAPGRFSAAINQAPMRRHGLGFAGDWVKNRILAKKEAGMPPAHLLRMVFEHAKTYDEAKFMLTKTPLAVPAIFTLAGTGFGQGCVIERLEQAAEVFELSGMQISTANHFRSAFNNFAHGWRPREIDSAGRYRQSCTFSGQDMEQGDFGWLTSPVINANTRMCMVANATTRQLIVQGYEGNVPVTELFVLPGSQSTEEKQADFMEAV